MHGHVDADYVYAAFLLYMYHHEIKSTQESPAHLLHHYKLHTACIKNNHVCHFPIVLSVYMLTLSANGERTSLLDRDSRNPCLKLPCACGAENGPGEMEEEDQVKR